MDNRPIGVFDSGVGGLTALKALRSIMPFENIIYLADTANMPYGNKNKEEIVEFINKDLNFLKSKNVKAILAACGTASSCMNLIQNSSENFIGVIKPACCAALKITKNNKIGILGTSATIKSCSYRNELYKINNDVYCYQQACPQLASLIENGNVDFENKKLKDALEEYITPLLEKNVDTIILGCTHYSVVSDVIKNIFKENLNLVDSGKEAAIFLSEFLKNKNLNANNNKLGYQEFYVSSKKTEFLNVAKIFLGNDISSNVSCVNLTEEEIKN